MKAIKRNLKWGTKIISLLILLESCTVYHKYTSSVDEAIATNNKVKLVIEDRDTYKFEKLERIDGEIFGLVYSKSKSFDRLKSRKIKPTEKQTLVFVQVYDNELNDIHLKNRTASTILSVAVPVVALGVILIPILNNPLDPYGNND